ncbi:hypothetical protein DENSPDRAFT_931726 [Dentipellis sp. KUC8613]|nr:hypothetical protein DENSPDRAFT_931726 [Dentipellis sp. KUC8613]
MATVAVPASQATNPQEVGTVVAYGSAPLSPATSRGTATPRSSMAATPLHVQFRPDTPPVSLPHFVPAASQHQHTEPPCDLILTPISPESVKRYDRELKRTDGKDAPSDIIEPLTKKFNHPLEESQYGWCRRQHPEGAMFFEHVASRTYTDMDIGSENTCRTLKEIMRILATRLRELGSVQATDEELVLEHISDNQWGYYFASHAERKVFWVHRYCMPSQSVDGISSRAQQGHEIESYFWTHVELFPKKLPKGSIRILKDHLAQAIIDNITSTESLSPYNTETMKKIQETLGNAKEDDLDDLCAHNEKGIVWAVARLLSHLYHARFIHFHGELTPRLSAGQTLKPMSGVANSRLFKIITVLLFGRPEAALAQLKAVSVDGIVVLATWEKYVQTSVIKWKDNADLCRMAVNYNLAFMAVPSVVRAISDNAATTSAAAQHWTLAQLLSTCSTILLSGSLVSNFLLRELYSEGKARDVTWATQFIANQRVNDGFFLRDLERLAILSSLPLTWIIWGVMLLALSFACWIFESTFVLSYRATVAVLLVFSGSIALLNAGLWYGLHRPAHAGAWRAARNANLVRLQCNWDALRTNVAEAVARRLNAESSGMRRRRRRSMEQGEAGTELPWVGHGRRPPTRSGTAPATFNTASH